LGPEAGDAQQVEQPRGELGGELLAQRQLAGRDDLGDLLRQVFADPGDVGQIPGAHAHQFRDRLGEVPDGTRGVAIGAHPEGVGVFVAPLLPLGTYDVTARAVGLGERKQTGIVLRVGVTVDLALKLQPVELAALTLTATPLVDVTKVETSTRLPNQAVAGLPNNGRNFLNLTL